MQKEEMSYSFYVIAGFIFLFLIFVIIQPKPETTGLISLNFLGNQDSKLPLIITVVTIIIALGLAIMAYKHFKKKKQLKPQPQANNQAPEAPKSSLTQDEIKALFPEGPEQQVLTAPPPQPIAAQSTPQPTPQPPIAPPAQPTIKLINLQEIKETIIKLISQGQSKQQILESLQSKGCTIQQITKATEELNYERLIQYIKTTLSQGFKKEQITKVLLESGWQQEMVVKAFQSLGV